MQKWEIHTNCFEAPAGCNIVQHCLSSAHPCGSFVGPTLRHTMRCSSRVELVRSSPVRSPCITVRWEIELYQVDGKCFIQVLLLAYAIFCYTLMIFSPVSSFALSARPSAPITPYRLRGVFYSFGRVGRLGTTLFLCTRILPSPICKLADGEGNPSPLFG